jgi:hypothetical protein
MKLLLLLLASVCFAQPTRTVTLTWADTLNPAGTLYNLYRASGTCGSGSLTFTRIASNLSAKTYSDVGVTPGQYCYAATANINSIESAQSVPAGAQVTPFAPTGMSVIVQ